LVLHEVAAVTKTCHDATVGCYAVAVVARLKGLDEDCVAVAVVGQHDVLVAAAGAGGKAAHVVSVELADGFDPYVEFV
jgi:hypothetical protein